LDILMTDNTNAGKAKPTGAADPNQGFLRKGRAHSSRAVRESESCSRATFRFGNDARNERNATRLVVAACDLDADDLKLAARQIEALAEHRNTG
jgi:hypothetical protein